MIDLTLDEEINDDHIIEYVFRGTSQGDHKYRKFNIFI